MKNLFKINSVCELWDIVDCAYGKSIAIVDDYCGYRLTYKELAQRIKHAKAGFEHLGLAKGEHVAQFSENNAKWVIADQAILMCGAINAVRGSQAPTSELEYIYGHSDSIALVTDSEDVINNLAPMLSAKKAKFIIYTGNNETEIKEVKGITVFTLEQVVEIGQKAGYKEMEIDPNSLATIVYSSGTTGKPKGIMLSHANLASQPMAIHPVLRLKAGYKLVSVLPIWHTYERTCEYYMFYAGISVHYSNVKNFKKDVVKYSPHYIVAVPRIFEAVYTGIKNEIKSRGERFKNIVYFLVQQSVKRRKALRLLNGTDINNQNPTLLQKITARFVRFIYKPLDVISDKVLYTKFRKALGDNYMLSISGGGAMPHNIEDFCEAVGIEVYVGYGLTETSPVLSVRRQDNNKYYAAGEPLPLTEFKIVDTTTFAPLSTGEKGLVLARGPQVMMGYYKDEEATRKVILPDGFFITGDIGWLCKDGTLVLTGRLKDTIVLSNGENVEPEGIEFACLTSDYVSQVVLTGQDKNSLSALVVPDMQEIEKWANLNNCDVQSAMSNPILKNQVLADLRAKVKSRSNYRDFERISNIQLLEEAFSIENGMMTQTAKIKKGEVLNKYQDVIEKMYS